MVIWQLPHDQDYAFPVINQRLIKELHLRFLAKLQLIPCKYELSQGWFTYITSRNCGLYLEEIKTDTAWLLYAIVGHIKRSQPSLICLIWTDLTYFGINEKHFIISLLTKHCFINFVLNFHNQSSSNKFGNFVRARMVTPGQHYSSLQNMIRVVFKQTSIALFPASILLCNLKVCNLNRVSNQAMKSYERKSWQIML